MHQTVDDKNPTVCSWNFGSGSEHYDSLFFEFPGLPDIRQIGTQTQRAAAMDASKRTESTEIVLDSTRPEKPRPLLETLHVRSGADRQVNLGVASQRCWQLRAQKDFKTDATAVL